MRYEDPQGEAALRYDRWGTRRGLPYAADPAWDDPPGRGPASDADARVGGGGGGWTGSANRWDEPGRGFRSSPRGGRAASDDGQDGGYGAYDDGYGVEAGPLYRGPWLPPRVWVRWRRRPWFPRFYRMLRRARPAGVLRHRRTGARYPVFRGWMGGRGWRVVTRPRGGRRFEVVGLEAETGFPNEIQRENESESEMLALPGAGASTSSGYAPADLTSAPGGGYRLRLPHQGIHTILARLRPEQLRTLTGGPLPEDPAAAVARGVGRVARRARRLGRLRSRGGGAGLEVFGTPGFRLLVRPTGEMEGEILAVTPVAGEAEGEVTRSVNANVTWHGPFKFTRKGVLKPTQKGQTVPGLNASGVYLVEKQGKKNPSAAYVGQADNFGQRLGTRAEHMRQMAASTRRHRVYLGIPSGPQSGLDDVEHATVRSVIRGLGNAGPNADATRKAASIKDRRVTNERPRAPFKVGAGGLNVTHTAAQGQSIPAYLRSGTGKTGQWYEFPE